MRLTPQQLQTTPPQPLIIVVITSCYYFLQVIEPGLRLKWCWTWKMP